MILVEFITYSNPEKLIYINPEAVEAITDNVGHARICLKSGEDYIVKASPSLARELLQQHA